jgi:hypothetical protein
MNLCLECPSLREYTANLSLALTIRTPLLLTERDEPLGILTDMRGIGLILYRYDYKDCTTTVTDRPSIAQS